jgi:hypothetical protein
MRFQDILDKYIQSNLKSKISNESIAKKHNVSLDLVQAYLNQGIKVEMEHTPNKKIAEIIASHHLNERIDYYKKLRNI